MINLPIKLIGVLCLIVLFACEEALQPKPLAYFRIELPQQDYQFMELPNFSFEYNAHSKIVQKIQGTQFNLLYPSIHATLYLSYAPVQNDLVKLIDQEYEMRERHNAFVSGVKESVFEDSVKKVNALIFEFKGKKAATPLQFMITDSVNHFVRGTLYFDHTPNNDSLAPVIDFLRKDLEHIIHTFNWKY